MAPHDRAPLALLLALLLVVGLASGATVVVLLRERPAPPAAEGADSAPASGQPQRVKGPEEGAAPQTPSFSGERAALIDYLGVLDRSLTLGLLTEGGVDVPAVVRARQAANACETFQCPPLEVLMQAFLDSGRQPPPRPRY